MYARYSGAAFGGYGFEESLGECAEAEGAGLARESSEP